MLPDIVFTVDELARKLGINQSSARVLCSRYYKSGKILRIRNNLYIIKERWQYLGMEDRLRIANRIQVPSYISLSSAVDYYELSTQMYRSRIESIAQKRSIEYMLGSSVFSFHLIKSDYYKGFTLKNGLFIAEPEKAMADIIYLVSLNRYSFDFSAVEWKRMDRKKLGTWLDLFPQKTKQWWRRYEYLSQA
ncbi:MAG: type IV toxin-antitoxin system AbiEi family antitoxin domain-containing protein [Fidelibacterota bacterium]